MARRRRRFTDREQSAHQPTLKAKGIRDWRQRHAVRLEFNLQAQDELRDWCSQHGIKLSVHNDGHHWIFRAGRKLAEWWPSSAKLVIDKQWRAGIHVHDCRQVMAELRDRYVGLHDDSAAFAFNSI